MHRHAFRENTGAIISTNPAHGGLWGSEHQPCRSTVSLWTSLLPRRFVICQVKPLSGSSPGCDISSPNFLISCTYLAQQHPLRLSETLTHSVADENCWVFFYCIVVKHAPEILNPKPNLIHLPLTQITADQTIYVHIMTLTNFGKFCGKSWIQMKTSVQVLISLACDKSGRNQTNILLSIKMLHIQILVPNENVLVWFHNIWVQKSLSIPPAKLSETTIKNLPHFQHVQKQ
jgi:hypothetical protein